MSLPVKQVLVVIINVYLVRQNRVKQSARIMIGVPVFQRGAQLHVQIRGGQKIVSFVRQNRVRRLVWVKVVPVSQRERHLIVMGEIVKHVQPRKEQPSAKNTVGEIFRVSAFHLRGVMHVPITVILVVKFVRQIREKPNVLTNNVFVCHQERRQIVPIGVIAKFVLQKKERHIVPMKVVVSAFQMDIATIVPTGLVKPVHQRKERLWGAGTVVLFVSQKV